MKRIDGMLGIRERERMKRMNKAMFCSSNQMSEANSEH